MADEQITQQAATDTVVNEVPETANTEIDTGPKWYDSLSEDLRSNKNITKFGTLEDYASWQSNASKLMGKKIEAMSAEDIKQFMTPEELIQAAEMRGLPKSIEEYDVPSLASVSDPTLVQSLKEVAFKEGIAPKQVEALIQFNQKVQQERMEQQNETWKNELISTYGSKAGEEIEMAQKAASQFCSPELIQQMIHAGMDFNPEIVKAFAKVAREMLPDHIPRGKTVHPSANAATESDIKSLIADPDFNRRWRSGDQKAHAELNALYGKLK